MRPHPVWIGNKRNVVLRKGKKKLNPQTAWDFSRTLKERPRKARSEKKFKKKKKNSLGDSQPRERI